MTHISKRKRKKWNRYMRLRYKKLKKESVIDLNNKYVTDEDELYKEKYSLINKIDNSECTEGFNSIESL